MLEHWLIAGVSFGVFFCGFLAGKVGKKTRTITVKPKDYRDLERQRDIWYREWERLSRELQNKQGPDRTRPLPGRSL